MKSANNLTIISGGQTGVDRAALDFALSNGLVCSGWCPQGRLAEDGFINMRYPLSEVHSVEHTVRTELNVLDSDATLIIYCDEMDKGTLATKDFAFEHRKPLFVWKIGVNSNHQQFLKWMITNNVKHLNIAGPKASNAPKIYGETLDLLDKLLADYVRKADKRMY
ncbi:MAG: putative molybdenum carrier protein [Bacteroidales bacterium]|nr:putative molybdenum carrier protein [Bacteroidales bacterium]